MILQALHALAQRERLVEDPDYELKPVAWLIRVADGGRLVGIEGTHSAPPATGKKKPKPTPKMMSVPRQSIRTAGDLAFFLCDKAEYVLGLDPETDPTKRRPEVKLRQRTALFREQAHRCGQAIRDVGIAAVCAFLDSVASDPTTVALPKDCIPNELFAFIYDPDVDTLVTDRPAVREYWKGVRSAKPTIESTEPFQCLVSGRVTSTAGLFPLIKKVPGGTPSGNSLVSFNSAAFLSYGLDGNENAAVSRDAAEACSTALNRLLDPAPKDPSDPDRALKVRNLRLSADTVVCYWASHTRSDEFLDAFSLVLNPTDPDKVGDAYRSVFSGRRTAIEDPSAFYALTLTGVQGRVVVRDWIESTVAEVAANLAMHFDDLNIVRNTPNPKDKSLPPVLPLRVLMESLAPLGKSDDIPAALAGAVVNAALRGVPYPLAILQKALERTRAEIGRPDWADQYRRDARAALIKAVLNRRRRRIEESRTRHPEVKPDMDPANVNPGYLLGQMMTVLERIQQEAMRDVNASIVDRFFGAASATPKAVFVRLLKNARHHVRKMRDDSTKGGLAFRLECLLDELADKFGARTHHGYPNAAGFPSFLGLEDQGLFVLGYHQMRKWLWMSKEERDSWERLNPDAPRAYLWGKGKDADAV